MSLYIKTLKEAKLLQRILYAFDSSKNFFINLSPIPDFQYYNIISLYPIDYPPIPYAEFSMAL